VASIALRNPANYKGAVTLNPAQFRYGFANELTEAEAATLYETTTMASPGKPLFEAASANFNPSSPAKVAVDHVGRGPLLLTSGGKDHTVPPAVVHATQKLYRHTAAVTDLLEFPDRGHSLTVDHGWREVADAALDWLDKQAL
jgi:pimeloyl-ACP methyl ester carboxylesterase